MINLEREFTYSVALSQVPKDGHGNLEAMGQIVRLQRVSTQKMELSSH
jgi:hypothetical protein